MSEKLCLQWNDFKENAISAFGRLKAEADFADVTLVCEDGQQVEAHKVILASSSPFFENILKKNRRPHLLIYMRGVNSDDLLAIIDFLYTGEANVHQESLDTFLGIADELQLKGLRKPIDTGEDIQTKNIKKPKKANQRSNKEAYHTSDLNQTEIKKEISIHGTAGDQVGKIMELMVMDNFSGDAKELDEKCISLMRKTSKKQENGFPLYECSVCGKEATNGNLKKHIEENHIEGISLPCKTCDKTFRSKAPLKHINAIDQMSFFLKINFHPLSFRNRRALQYHEKREHQYSVMSQS